jgi:hypothetical protein
MKTYSITKQLPVEAERVWAVLTDAAKLASGPTGITRLEGRIAPGEKVKLWTQATGDRPFSLQVTTFEPARSLVWEGGMPLRLFWGVRRFTLTPNENGVQFEMSETFSGPLSGLVVKPIPDLTPSFETFTTGLLALAQKE